LGDWWEVGHQVLKGGGICGHEHQHFFNVPSQHIPGTLRHRFFLFPPAIFKKNKKARNIFLVWRTLEAASLLWRAVPQPTVRQKKGQLKSQCSPPWLPLPHLLHLSFQHLPYQRAVRRKAPISYCPPPQNHLPVGPCRNSWLASPAWWRA